MSLANDGISQAKRITSMKWHCINKPGTHCTGRKYLCLSAFFPLQRKTYILSPFCVIPLPVLLHFKIFFPEHVFSPFAVQLNSSFS